MKISAMVKVPLKIRVWIEVDDDLSVRDLKRLVMTDAKERLAKATRNTDVEAGKLELTSIIHEEMEQ